MNAQLLIQSVIQQTTIFVAQLATSGGVRASLAQVANQVFIDLSSELSHQGVSKNVIADMFGLTLRTYHRRVAELSQSQSVEGRSIWEAVLEYVRQHEPVSAAKVFQRFVHDDREVVAGALNDLVNSQLCYRAGRGASAVYRFADGKDFGEANERSREEANDYLVWQAVYRNGPLDTAQVQSLTHLPHLACEGSLARLLERGRVTSSGQPQVYTSDRIDVPVGQSAGWEAAVFDHYQAVVSAICTKLAASEGSSAPDDTTGGATYSFDLWPGHPLEGELLATLSRFRSSLEELRQRVDRINGGSLPANAERLVVYVGQHLKSDRRSSQEG